MKQKETSISRIDIELLIDMIIDGKTYRQMADIFGVKLSTLSDFVAKPEHSARVKEALKTSSDTYADKAEQVLIDAKSNLIEVQRAKELSQYYKWKASKRNPRDYGDKMDVTTDGEKITSFNVGFKKPEDDGN